MTKYKYFKSKNYRSNVNLVVESDIVEVSDQTSDGGTTPTLQEVTDEGAVTTETIGVGGLEIYDSANDDYLSITSADGQIVITRKSDNKVIAQFERNNFTFLNEDDFGSTLTNQNLTASRSYSFLDESGDLPITTSKNANFTAVNSVFYTAIATLTVTDPTPVEGQGYIVFVRNGTATIGGVGYTSGNLIYRFYQGGAWSSTVFGVSAPINTATQTALKSQNFFDTRKASIKLSSSLNGLLLIGMGGIAPSSFGTGSFVTKSPTGTNSYTKSKRVALSTTASAGTVFGYRISATHFVPTGLDYFEQTLGSSDGSATSGMRAVFGIFINTGTATSNIEYNTLTELVGLCRLSSSNNWHIIHNDASGTATTIDLGSNFIATNENVANSLITFKIIATSATTCTVRVTNAAGLVHEEIITSDLPDLDSPHTVKGIINNNANAVTYMVDYHDAVELFK